MNEIKFTFIRHAISGAYPIDFFEYHRTYFVGLEIYEKFGKVDAIYCSCSPRAVVTAQILGIAQDCDVVKPSDVLNCDVSEAKQQKFFEEIKAVAKANNQKHILFVMHEPGLGALINRGMYELNFFNVDSDSVGKTKLHSVEMNFLNEPEKKYPELYAMMLKKLGEHNQNSDGLINAIKEFHRYQNWEGLISKTRLWKSAFLKEAEITNLTEDHDWIDILVHPKCLDFDVFEMLDASFQYTDSLTQDEFSQLKCLPWYNSVSDGSNYMFYPAFMELPVSRFMENLVYFRKVVDAKFFKLYQAEAIVSEDFAKKLASFNLLIYFPYPRYMCSLSFRTELSEAMVSARKKRI